MKAQFIQLQFRAAAVTVAVFVAWTFAFIISSAYLPFQEVFISSLIRSFSLLVLY